MSRYLYTLLLLFFFQMSHACTCAPIYNNKGEEVPQKVDLIIKATVVRIDTIYTIPESYVRNDVKDSSGMYPYTRQVKVTLLVHKSFKGKHKSKKITLVTGVGGGDCGYHFKTNKQYLIYGIYEDLYFFANSGPGPNITKQSYLTTNDCSKTTDNIKQGVDKLLAMRHHK